MKLCIIISVLDSHWVVQQYIRHIDRMGLPPDIETIFMDDGSDPPLQCDHFPRNFSIRRTGNKGMWTGGLARNEAARMTNAEYVLMTDIDHILTYDAIHACRLFTGDKMVFFRYAAIFGAHAEIITDSKTLAYWGVGKRIFKNRMCGGVHTNTFCMRRKLFWDIGGYCETRCRSGLHTQHEDADLNSRFNRWVRSGKAEPQVTGPNIYFYATGRFHRDGEENPYGLFHTQPHHKWGEPA